MRVPTSSTSQHAVRPSGPAQIDARFLTHRAFLAQALVGPEKCRFFVSGVNLPPRTPVRVRVAFEGEQVIFFVAATVVRQEDLRTSAQVGVVVEVTGADLDTFGRLHAHARGSPPELRRRGSDRLPVQFRAELTTPVGSRLHGVVRDLSRGGAFVALASARLAVGAPVRLVIRLGFWRRLAVQGRVAWTGERREGMGVGIEFRDMTTDARRKLAAALARLARA